MKRKTLKKQEDGKILMSNQNIKICIQNQQGAQTFNLNTSLHLQYYGFQSINNLNQFNNLNTLFLNNNCISKIQNIQHLASLKILNLSQNKINILEGISKLTKLVTLDVSNNNIQHIDKKQIQTLIKLNSLKIGYNKLSKLQSYLDLNVLQKLAHIDFTANPLQFSQNIIQEFFKKIQIKVLVLTGTNYGRNLQNYRKKMIYSLKSLKYLDDRPVTQDQRLIAQSWAQKGVQGQKQARQKVRQKLRQKNNKIYSQMQQRTKQVDIKRQLVYRKFTSNEDEELKNLIILKNSEQFQLATQQRKKLIQIKIEQLSKYMQIMKDQMSKYDLNLQLNDGAILLPKMIIDKQTPTTIYVYNVLPQQIPLIKQKYYPQDNRQIVAVNSPKISEKWFQQYNQLLDAVYKQSNGNIELLCPLFNLALYEFNQGKPRKIVRFIQMQLTQKLKKINEFFAEKQSRMQSLNQLD